MKQNVHIPEPLLKKLKRVAARHGSTASTSAGLLRWLYTGRNSVQWREPNPRFRAAMYEQRYPDRQWDARRTITTHPGYAPPLSEDERAVRRSLAKGQEKFKTATVKRLKKEIRKLVGVESQVCDLATLTTATSTRRSRGAQIERTNAWLLGLCPRWTPLSRQPIPGYKLDLDERTARKAGVKLDMHCSNPRIISCETPSHLVSASPVTTGSGSYTRTVKNAVRDNYVRSVCLITSPQRLVYVLHESEHVVELPDGCVWNQDENGIRILETATGADYHPSAYALAFCDIQHSITQLHNNRETRLTLKAKQAAERAELEGVYVCAADSLRAGNCWQGTLSFVSRHHLDSARHYKALELLGMANGDASRVRLAISAATQRHRRETERGFAELLEHVLPKE